MTKPSNPDWATSTNFSAGTYSGQTTKSTPGAATIAEGFNADAPLPVEWLNERINNHAKWIRWMDGAQRTNNLQATWMTPQGSANVYYDGGFVTGRANSGTVTTSGGGGAVYDSPFIVGGLTLDQDVAFCVTSRSLQIPSFFSGSLSFDIKMLNVGANNMTIFAGMATALTAGAGVTGALVAAASGIGFQKKSTDTHWRCLTANGATLTNTDSGITPGAATVANLRIDIVGDDGTANPAATFYINDSPISTPVNTINATADMFVWWQVSATAATANTSSLGTVGCSWTRMSGY